MYWQVSWNDCLYTPCPFSIFNKNHLFCCCCSKQLNNSVCVCLYPSTVETSSVCNDALEILECADQLFCVVGIILDTSSKFLHLSFWIYHIPPPKTKLQQVNKLKRKWNNMWHDIWYGAVQICTKGYIFDVGYKSVAS